MSNPSGMTDGRGQNRQQVVKRLKKKKNVVKCGIIIRKTPRHISLLQLLVVRNTDMATVLKFEVG